MMHLPYPMRWRQRGGERSKRAERKLEEFKVIRGGSFVFLKARAFSFAKIYRFDSYWLVFVLPFHFVLPLKRV